MIKNKISLITLLALFGIPSISNAQSSGGHGGDGDEAEYQEIQRSLLTWVNDGNAKELDFTIGGENKTDYENKMRKFLPADPKNPTVKISFTQNRLYVDHKEKTCVSTQADSGEDPHTECNIKRWRHTRLRKKYRLVAHETATFSGLEVTNDYHLSNQLIIKSKWVRLNRIAVKRIKERMRDRDAASTTNDEGPLRPIPSLTEVNLNSYISDCINNFAPQIKDPPLGLRKPKGGSYYAEERRAMPTEGITGVTSAGFISIDKHEITDLIEGAPERAHVGVCFDLNGRVYNYPPESGGSFYCEINPFTGSSGDAGWYDLMKWNNSYKSIEIPFLKYDTKESVIPASIDNLGVAIPPKSIKYVENISLIEKDAPQDHVPLINQNGGSSKLTINLQSYRSCLFGISRNFRDNGNLVAANCRLSPNRSKSVSLHDLEALAEYCEQESFNLHEGLWIGKNCRVYPSHFESPKEKYESKFFFMVRGKLRHSIDSHECD